MTAGTMNITLQQLETWITRAQQFLLALFLAFILAYGAFWGLGFLTNADSWSLSGSDFGISELVVCWFCALCWGCIVCFPLSKRLIGAVSLAAYVYASVLFPLALWILTIFENLLIGRTARFHLNESYAKLFTSLSFGLLRQRSVDFDSTRAFMFMAIFIAGVLGFLHTQWTSQKKGKGA